MSDARRLLALPSPLRLYRGGSLIGASVAFETWGRLSPRRDNAVLVFTGLSPSAHAASSEADPSPGWWEAMIGPGKAIDTHRWFVICVNSLGSCFGSTGPASPDPATGRPYRLRFPALSLEDVAEAGFEVLRSLRIERLAAVIGPSMGGMSALALLALHPAVARSAILISTATAARPFAIALRSLQRQAVMADPAFAGGGYRSEDLPLPGMLYARKLGMLTYRSPEEWQQRFARRRSSHPSPDAFGMVGEFEVEAYLENRAAAFSSVFDPCCYLYLSRASDWFDLSDHGDGERIRPLARAGLERALVLGTGTDILYPLEQQRELANDLCAAGCAARFESLPSLQGHDAFLIDHARFAPPIAEFLAALS